MRTSLSKWTTIVSLTSIFLFTIVGANFFLLSHPQSVHAAAAQPQAAPTSLTPAKAQTIVEMAGSYVHVVNSKATIDPAIRAQLDAKDVAIVQALVAHYNTLPLTQKLPRSISGASHTTAGASPYAFGCNQYMHVQYYWWGTQVYLNHCLIITLGAFGIGGVIGAIAASLAFLGIFIGAYIAALVLTDANCGNRGAFLDNYFGSVWWVNGVC